MHTVFLIAVCTFNVGIHFYQMGHLRWKVNLFSSTWVNLNHKRILVNSYYGLSQKVGNREMQTNKPNPMKQTNKQKNLSS